MLPGAPELLGHVYTLADKVLLKQIKDNSHNLGKLHDRKKKKSVHIRCHPDHRYHGRSADDGTGG